VDQGVGTDRTVHLHIGTMKSGTSYLQGALEHVAPALSTDGVLYPGSVGPAVHEVLEKRGARHFGDVSGAWDELAASISAWQGKSAILSMEFLGLATTEQAERIVGSLAPFKPHVIITARDLGRTIPSVWQQTTKNRQTTTWPDFLAAICVDDDQPDDDEDPLNDASAAKIRQQFWRHHDVPSIVRTWSSVVGVDRVTVITLPPSGSDPSLLWERFCAATGLDDERYPAPPPDAGRSNSSLGYAEAEMMRRLNVELGRDVDQAIYRHLVTGFISRRVLRRGVDPTPAPVLPPDVRAWAADQATEVIGELSDLGVAVIGDLEELRPAPSTTSTGTERDDPSDADVAAVAIRAVAALVGRLGEAESMEPGKKQRPAQPPKSRSAAAGSDDPKEARRAQREQARRAQRTQARRAQRDGAAKPREGGPPGGRDGGPGKGKRVVRGPGPTRM
jgi:hypothetical protein